MHRRQGIQQRRSVDRAVRRHWPTDFAPHKDAEITMRRRKGPFSSVDNTHGAPYTTCSQQESLTETGKWEMSVYLLIRLVWLGNAGPPAETAGSMMAAVWELDS